MAKLCEKCGNGHEKSGKFCSRSCANSRVFSAESKEKKRLAMKGKPWNRGPKTEDEKKIVAAKLKARSEQVYNEKSFDELSIWQKKRRVLEDQDYKCNKCGVVEWMGQPLCLELEHKDGDTKNNERSNLECICPNCHSQTDTWRGRNIKKKVSDAVLLEAIKTSLTIAEALRSVGLPDKGSSYSRAHKLAASIKVMQ